MFKLTIEETEDFGIEPTVELYSTYERCLEEAKKWCAGWAWDQEHDAFDDEEQKYYETMAKTIESATTLEQVLEEVGDQWMITIEEII